ncbi:unnamed protein product [Trypanosoma congolense IL3000]|uniref:WGS project CAEQ00000000 data, annotated contig 2443 n=1 Tax=Trypanosoma congolense (strain IL3000) TaxID=1068625 RepID=F9WE75_TRYCI|nr:unnamed protein product [Trypanosoma congolense IL3000]
MNKPHGYHRPTGWWDDEFVPNHQDVWYYRATTLCPPRPCTMRTSVLDVLADSVNDPDNLNLLHFLERWYTDLPLHLLRFTVGDFIRDPERCLLEDRLSQEIWDNLARRRTHLYGEMLDQYFALSGAQILTLEDWAQRGSSLTVHPLARGFLEEAVKQAKEPVEQQKPVYLPSPSSQPMSPRPESSPVQEVQEISVVPPIPKPQEVPLSHGSPPTRQKRQPSPPMESMDVTPIPKPQEVPPSHGSPPTRRKRQPSPPMESMDVTLIPKPQEAPPSHGSPPTRRKRQPSPPMESMDVTLIPNQQEVPLSHGSPPTRRKRQPSHSDVKFLTVKSATPPDVLTRPESPQEVNVLSGDTAPPPINP